MEGDFLFKEWCKANHRPTNYSEIETFYGRTMTTQEKDDIWEKQLEEYDAYNNPVFNIEVSAEDQNKLIYELSRFGVVPDWMHDTAIVPIKHKQLVLNILDGIRGRNTITPVDFGGHLKK